MHTYPTRIRTMTTANTMTQAAPMTILADTIRAELLAIREQAEKLSVRAIREQAEKLSVRLSREERRQQLMADFHLLFSDEKEPGPETWSAERAQAEAEWFRQGIEHKARHVAERQAELERAAAAKVGAAAAAAAAAASHKATTAIKSHNPSYLATMEYTPL